jgi:type I restriction enzyme R subunit
MRHLIDSYIGAEESRTLASFDNMTFVDMLVNEPGATYLTFPASTKEKPGVMAEVIENNLRKVIIEESPLNPAHYGKMSVLLSELIRKRKETTIEYEKYLQEIIAFASRVKSTSTSAGYPYDLTTKAMRALYDNLEQNEEAAVALHKKIISTKKDGWRDNFQKTKAVRNAIDKVLQQYGITEPVEMQRIFELVKNQVEY